MTSSASTFPVDGYHRVRLDLWRSASVELSIGPEGTDPFVNTRVKLAESSKVYALVKADGKYYYAAKEVKVTIGGCGG